MIKKYPSSKEMKVFNNYSDKTLDAIIKLYQDDSPYKVRKTTRNDINKAVRDVDFENIRKYSNYFYYSNNIYYRAINYFSNMLCYYWMITPRIRSSKINEVTKDNIIDTWWDALLYIENINPESIGPYIANKVLLYGACYIEVK